MSTLTFFESRLPSGTKLPLRSTLVTLSKGQRILISPVQFTENQLDELKKNPPHAIVAPNLYHHLFVNQAAQQLNISTIFTAPGLEKKRKDIEWPIILGDKTWTYQDELPLHLVQGMPSLNECVFFHKESKSLIVTDLLFNLHDLPDSLKSTAFKILDTFNKPSISRLLYLALRDKKAFKNSINEILKWDFDRLVMAHGKIIESNAKEIFKAAASERGLL